MKKKLPLISFILFIICFPAITLAQNTTSIIYYIEGYGAIKDGKTLSTMSIQKAIDDCHKHGSGTIEIPAGNFVRGTLRLYSNMNLHFEAGASLGTFYEVQKVTTIRTKKLVVTQ